MLWIAVCLPHLPLEVHAVTDVALAICDAQRITYANAVARHAGINRGMRRATALALCPTLTLARRDPIKEQQALEAVAVWALQFTPNVSLLPIDTEIPSGLLLEVRGSLRLFGGLAAIESALRHGLAAQGHAARLAVAPVPQAAWLLARGKGDVQVLRRSDLDNTVSALPAWLLGAGRTHWEALQGIGVRSIGDLRALPRIGITRRFSEALVDELDRAFGAKPDPREWFVAPPVFEGRIELMARVESAEALLFAAHRLIMQLCGWLTAQQSATRTMHFTLEHEGRAPTSLPLKLANASRDEARIVALLRETLPQVQWVAPVYALTLYCDDKVEASACSAQLFPTPHAEHEALTQLLERLMARLGRDRVLRLRPHEDHRPELAFETYPADTTLHSNVAANDATGIDAAKYRPPRPLWLLQHPAPLAVRGNAPHYGSTLTLIAGPERIEGGWWDGPWAARDYFIAQDTAHALYWIFRLRAPDPGFLEGGGWRLHGRFG